VGYKKMTAATNQSFLFMNGETCLQGGGVRKPSPPDGDCEGRTVPSGKEILVEGLCDWEGKKKKKETCTEEGEKFRWDC